VPTAAAPLAPPLQENAGGNAAAGPKAEGGAPKAEGSAPKPAGSGGKGSPTGPRGCLDALWELLQARQRLQAEQPAVLAKLLQVCVCVGGGGGGRLCGWMGAAR
jgi:hypothetical protein